MKYLVGTTVEKEYEANSLIEAKCLLEKDLKSISDIDIGDMNGFEVPDEEEEL